ncbi:hypothetical protein D3C85_1803490 [compost metagenome]
MGRQLGAVKQAELVEQCRIVAELLAQVVRRCHLAQPGGQPQGVLAAAAGPETVHQHP